jgi:hypothetical protein
MDITRAITESTVQVECPHCGHVEDDEYECLESDRLLDLRCPACGRSFYLALMQCQACAAESLSSWMRRPSSERFEHLRCLACSQPYRDHEAASACTDLFE